MDTSATITIQFSSKSSSFPLVLRVSRVIFLLSLTFLFLFTLALIPEIYFLYYTDWGLFLSVIYFFLANLSYSISGLDKILSALFLVIWTSNWVITLIFWIYLLPSISPEDLAGFVPAHTLPILASVTEYLLNQLPFIRKYYVFSVGIFLVYGCLVLGPYTLTHDIVYPGITFTNANTYLLLLAILSIYAVSLEVGRIIKIQYFGVGRVLNNRTTGRELLMVSFAK